MGFKLAEGLLEIGYSVMIGSRDTGKQRLQEWTKRGENASVGSFEQAASFGDIVILATPWHATENAIKLAGAQNMSGKTVIDVTNPLDFSKGAPSLALGFSDSAGETVQRMLPAAKVVKAFNTIGQLHMFRPDFPCGPPTMFICGNDADSKKQVTEILEKFGWETIDTGGIAESRLLEPLALVWIKHYMNTGSGNHAFKLLKK